MGWVDIAPIVSAVSAVITIVVLPLIAYVQRTKDSADRVRDEKISDLERAHGEHAAKVAELGARVENLEGMRKEISEIRGGMLTRSEWTGWANRFEAELRDLRRGR